MAIYAIRRTSLLDLITESNDKRETVLADDITSQLTVGNGGNIDSEDYKERFDDLMKKLKTLACKERAPWSQG